MLGRYWLGGPCIEGGDVIWLVLDGCSTPSNNIPVEKDRGSLEYCEQRLEELNKGYE